MLSKTKKAIILSGMLLLLVVTGYLNVVLNSAAEQPADSTGGNELSFFESHVLDRQAARDAALLILNGIITSPDSTEADKTAANAEKIIITQTIQMELTLESLIKAIGFSECVVTVNGDSVNVIIAAPDNITREQAAQILDIVRRETGVSPLNISIYPI